MRSLPLRAPLRASLFAFGALFAPLGGLAAAQGPFQPGMRWIDGASLQTPWIPTAVEFGAADNLVWVGAGVGSDRVQAYDTPGSGLAAPAVLDSTLGSGVDLVDVCSGGSARQLFALTQRNAPDVFHRITEVSRRDLLQASAGAGFAAQWTHSLGFAANGPARFECNASGSVVVAAAWSDLGNFVRIDRLDGDTGALLARTDVAAASLDELVLSADGTRAALIAESRLLVLAADGSVLHDQALTSGPASLAIDDAGLRIIVGAVGLVRVFDELTGIYTEVVTQPGPLTEVASHVGVSANGETWASAWWRFASRDLLRYEVYDGATSNLVLSTSQPGLANGLQNSPVGVRISPDGERIAFASWGKGDIDPEVMLFDKSSAALVMAIDLPGSVMDFDLDQSGTRIALVTKNLHANLFSTTGEVRLYDTGERDLARLSPSHLGGTLSVASRKPGASSTLFLLGVRSATPELVPGSLGELSLARSGRLYVFARPTDLQGESQLLLPLPATQALSSTNYSLQAATRVAGQIVFSATTLDLLFH